MKPIIIFIDDDTIKNMTREKLEELISKAYEQGYADGKGHSYIGIRPLETPRTPYGPTMDYFQLGPKPYCDLGENNGKIN